MLSALALAHDETEKLRLHFAEHAEIEFLGVTENFVGKCFLHNCFPNGTPSGFHGPVLGAIAVRGNGLRGLLGAVAKEDYILPLYDGDATYAAHAMFEGLREFLS